MRIIDWHLEHCATGCDIEGTVEVEDDATPADIEHEVREDMWDRISLTWKERDASDASPLRNA